MDTNRSRWGIEQWAAHMQNQALPVMRRSQLLIERLVACGIQFAQLFDDRSQ